MIRTRGVLSSPIGDLLVEASETGLTGVWFRNRARSSDPGRTSGGLGSGGGSAEVLAQAKLQLTEYFAGSRQSFDLPLEPEGTEFERKVWDLLRAIPFGATTSYGALAKQLGDLTLARAVGAANGANPIPIIVPCHRVIGSNGDLVGFGGGIERKEWLLKHEGALML